MGEITDLLDGKKLSSIMRYVAELVDVGQRVLELPSCNDCEKKRECEYVPGLGRPARFNCPLWQGKDENKLN